jgi:hypothetical protein
LSSSTQYRLNTGSVPPIRKEGRKRIIKEKVNRMMLISRIDSAKEEKKMGIIFFKRLRIKGMMKALRATPTSIIE